MSGRDTSGAGPLGIYLVAKSFRAIKSVRLIPRGVGIAIVGTERLGMSRRGDRTGIVDETGAVASPCNPSPP